MDKAILEVAWIQNRNKKGIGIMRVKNVLLVHNSLLNIPFGQLADQN